MQGVSDVSNDELFHAGSSITNRTILGFTVHSFNSTTISERHRSLLTGSKEENGLFLEIQKYEDSTEKEYSVAICRGHLV